jgi:hypothetical protein
MVHTEAGHVCNPEKYTRYDLDWTPADALDEDARNKRALIDALQAAADARTARSHVPSAEHIQKISVAQVEAEVNAQAQRASRDRERLQRWIREDVEVEAVDASFSTEAEPKRKKKKNGPPLSFDMEED